MLVKKEIDISQSPNSEQQKMLEEAQAMPLTYDEDSPALSDAELQQFQHIAEKNRADRRKQTVSLRLSPQALAKAKSLGKGYTSVLSRILEQALQDNDQIRRAL